MIRLALLIAAVSLGITTAATAEGLTPSTLINAGVLQRSGCPTNRVQ